MSTALPETVQGLDFELWTIEQPGLPCIFKECPTEATWYVITPHDQPCAIQTVCEDHKAFIEHVRRTVEHQLMHGHIIICRCMACWTVCDIRTVRFERIKP